jgi:hypothetical protein
MYIEEAEEGSDMLVVSTEDTARFSQSQRGGNSRSAISKRLRRNWMSVRLFLVIIIFVISGM